MSQRKEPAKSPRQAKPIDPLNLCGEISRHLGVIGEVAELVEELSGSKGYTFGFSLHWIMCDIVDRVARMKKLNEQLLTDYEQKGGK